MQRRLQFKTNMRYQTVSRCKNRRCYVNRSCNNMQCFQPAQRVWTPLCTFFTALHQTSISFSPDRSNHVDVHTCADIDMVICCASLVGILWPVESALSPNFRPCAGQSQEIRHNSPCYSSFTHPLSSWHIQKRLILPRLLEQYHVEPHGTPQHSGPLQEGAQGSYPDP